MSMREFIAKISKGPKAAKDLTWEEAKRAMQALVEGEATPAQIGAFLMALRIKVESVTELASMTAAARSYVAPVPIPQELGVVDLPSYADKQETFHALSAAAIVAAAAGASILMHGYDGISGRAGSAEVLKALGVPVDLEPRAVTEVVRRHGFAYLDIALYHPPIYRLLEMRRELGVRTIFHPIARLLNPARASSQVVGLSHLLHFEKTAEVLRMLGCQRALVVNGVEGDPELSIAAFTRVLELRNERIIPLSFASKDAGLPLGSQRDMAGFPLNQQKREADLVRRILHNQLPGGACNWVLMNAALILYAAGKGTTWASCVPLARRAVEGGAAARKLEDLAQEPVGAGVADRSY